MKYKRGQDIFPLCIVFLNLNKYCTIIVIKQKQTENESYVTQNLSSILDKINKGYHEQKMKEYGVKYKM